jgi:hypothetical protein
MNEIYGIMAAGNVKRFVPICMQTCQLAQAVNVLNCILVVSGLNLGRDSNYRD